MKNIIGLLVVVTVLFSCSPSYIPSAPHTPIFSNQGEFQARLNFGSSGIDPQLSYAVTEHLGVMANGSFYSEEDELGVTKGHANYELGAGWYRNKNGRFVFEVFGGYGMGTFSNGQFKNSTETFISDASLQKIFLQPAFGMVTDVFDFSIASRFSSISLKPEPGSDLATSTLFFEPVGSVSLGFKYIKANLQLGFSVPTNDQVNLAFQYQPIIFNMGITARIGRKYF